MNVIPALVFPVPGFLQSLQVQVVSSLQAVQRMQLNDHAFFKIILSIHYLECHTI